MKKAFRFSLVAIMFALVITLVSCTPSKPEAAQKKLEKAGYTIILNESSKNFETAETVLSASKTADRKLVSIIAVYYSSSKEAKAAYEKYVGENKNENVKLAGKWILIGSEEAIKDFTK